MNEQLVIPDWLVDIFLGYGDAGAAHYTQMNGLIRTVDFKVGAVWVAWVGGACGLCGGVALHDGLRV